MSIYNHITEFAGLPVIDFPEPAPDRPAALADPSSAAWRLKVDSYQPEEPFEEHFARFLEEVGTAHVAALIVGCWGESYEVPGSVPRDLLVAQADRLPALRALFFGEFVQEEAEISWIPQTDVTPLLAAFPWLEELVVRGGSGLEFSAVRHERLRRLTVQTGGLPRGVTAGVLASDLPALEHLELWFGVEDYGGTTVVGDLAPLLAGELFPALRHLGLRNSPWGDDLVRRLADAPVLERVEVLDLSGHVLTDAGGEVLATAPAFRTLERLIIDHHFLTGEMCDRIRAVLGGVELELSRGEQPDVYKGKTYYYPQTTE